MPYKSKRESRTRVEHGFGERRRDKARLSKCTRAHVVVVINVGVAVRNIGNDSRTATTGTILYETPKTHQRSPFFLSFLYYKPLALSLTYIDLLLLYKIYKQQILLTDFTPLSIMLLFWVFG